MRAIAIGALMLLALPTQASSAPREPFIQQHGSLKACMDIAKNTQEMFRAAATKLGITVKGTQVLDYRPQYAWFKTIYTEKGTKLISNVYCHEDGKSETFHTVFPKPK